jgi:hypothetical protein
VLATLVPFTAVSLAGMVNVLLTRSNELVDGLELTTADGEHVGMSRVAAQVCTPVWVWVDMEVLIPCLK